MEERPKHRRVRLAVVADIHCGEGAEGAYHNFFARMAEQADVVALCGDLTDYGRAAEAQVLVRELKAVAGKPVLAVFGNHDFESGEIVDVRKVLADGGVHVLEGGSFEYEGVGFAGVKGFMGGFGMHCLQSWGEASTKAFVQDALDEELKLEKALGHLQSETRVALMHYAPIEDTVVGEPVEIYPFLGCSRLEEPLDRYGVAAVFHGHAHAGTFEGRTSRGAPVYNVAMPVLRRDNPEEPPFFLWEAPHARQPQSPAQPLLPGDPRRP